MKNKALRKQVKALDRRIHGLVSLATAQGRLNDRMLERIQVLEEERLVQIQCASNLLKRVVDLEAPKMHTMKAAQPDQVDPSEYDKRMPDMANLEEFEKRMSDVAAQERMEAVCVPFSQTRTMQPQPSCTITNGSSSPDNIPVPSVQYDTPPRRDHILIDGVAYYVVKE
jgi:hypothetical protein